MKRFVDLRGAETGSYRFAFWDTIFDKFETYEGAQAWNTFDDFASDYDGKELDRYKGLCPAWTFKKDK